MNEPTYKASAFKRIVQAEAEDGACPLIDESAIDIQNAGVFVTDVQNVWAPSWELPDIDPADDEPSLKFPFTARQLAAFLIDGPGFLIREFYGDWSNGPASERIDLIHPAARSQAADALGKAFAAYREADSSVGPLDPSAEAEANRLADVARALETQVRREVGRDGLAASEPLQQARAASRQARQEADAAFADWRRRMVQHLLTEPAAPETPPAPAMEPAAEPQAVRQARRYQLCIDAGLAMPTDDYARLPDGIRAIADREGITRQSLSEDLKAHIRRLSGR